MEAMNVDEIQNFVTNLNRLIESKIISKSRLSELSGKSRSHIESVAEGKTDPGLKTCVAICKAAGFLLKDLLTPPQEFEERLTRRLAA